MNQFLPDRYVEIIHRLALGIEPLDAQRGGRLSYQLQALHAATLLGKPRPPLERHISNLFSLRYQPGVASPLELLLFDTAAARYRPEYDRRRIVPRRLQIPLLTLSAVESAESADQQGFRRRIRRPAFFPGAVYDAGSVATGLRGRAVRNGRPLRWARVLATLTGSSVIAGHAHGDDRGEFLLLINAGVTTGSSLPNPLQIDVAVFAPAAIPVPNPPGLPALDPLWDLPLESLAAPGADDPVAGGTVLPADYTAQVSRTVTLTLGRISSTEPEFVIT
jgi:hypothetical protein